MRAEGRSRNPRVVWKEEIQVWAQTARARRAKTRRDLILGC